MKKFKFHEFVLKIKTIAEIIKNATKSKNKKNIRISFYNLLLQTFC